jgi:hypothetical protein
VRPGIPGSGIPFIWLEMKRRAFLWENSLKFIKEPIVLRNPLKREE